MTCTCDMFPDPHPDGFVAEDGLTICEKALPGQRISPHLENQLNEMAQTHAESAPPLTDNQLATLRRILHQDASAHGVRQRPGV